MRGADRDVVEKPSDGLQSSNYIGVTPSGKWAGLAPALGLSRLKERLTSTSVSASTASAMSMIELVDENGNILDISL